MKTTVAFNLATLFAVTLSGVTGHAFGEESLRGPDIPIVRTTGPIAVDGDLSDPGWKEATQIETWTETSPGENIPPKVKTVGYLAFDDRYLYVALACSDPDPSKIRAPYADRDDISESFDYGGIVLDTRNDGRTAILFLASPRGIQYDAIQDDATGSETSSPDFYWDSSGKITAEGWNLEIRIPFSSLRYSGSGMQTWGIMLFRNYPRDSRYQLFTTQLPRGSNCFICHENTLVGLEGLPRADHVVVAPYFSAKQESAPRSGDSGSLVSKPVAATGGLDAKWTPSPDHAVDLAINPDFSQVESDVTKITANERFAIFYPEKRPFFLEGMELFSTPIQAVYTRTITSPRWGLRATGRNGNTAYTALVADDRGGGSVILPGADASSFAGQDFSSRVGVGRVRHDIGNSFVSFLVTDREIAGGGYNRVVGPDFQWRPTNQDQVTGQFLFSFTRDPNRPDLTPDWTGKKQSGRGMDVWWSHNTRTFDSGVQFKSFGEGFRTDVGFTPQVGYREGYTELGYTWRPYNFFSRIRAFSYADYMEHNDGTLLRSLVAAGVHMAGRGNSLGEFWLQTDRWRAGSTLITKRQFRFSVQATPTKFFSWVYLQGALGRDVDFENSRPADGASLVLGTILRPTDHLALRLDAERRWLGVRPIDGGPRDRLFTARVERLKATYIFNSRSYLRLIGQYERTDRDPALYTDAVPRKDGSFSGSALFSYKLNWQSVLFVGYGDDRILTAESGLERTGRVFFLKLSYAFQV